jgi:hypothetical protein
LHPGRPIENRPQVRNLPYIQKSYCNRLGSMAELRVA